MAGLESFTECVTFAAVAVTNAVGSGQNILSVGFAALTAAQQARVRAVLISVETEGIRLGGPEVTTTKGPLVPAGTLLVLPLQAGTLFASSISGTNSSVNITVGLE